MAVIYITEADNSKHKFRLPTDPSLPVTIGRNKECLVSLPQIIGISGHHCTITLVDGRHFIKDENSTNGTLEGKRAISYEALRAGATYTIGNACMTYDPERELADVPAAVPAPAKATVSPALAEAAAAIAPQRKRKAIAASALAEAAAAIGVKGVAESKPEPAAEPGGEKQPEARADAPETRDERKADAKPVPGPDKPKAEEPAKSDKPKAESKTPHRRRRHGGHAQDKGDAPAPSASAGKAQLVAVLTVVYVIAVLALAFYAGMTLRHWFETGAYLPSDTPAKAARP